MDSGYKIYQERFHCTVFIFNSWYLDTETSVRKWSYCSFCIYGGRHADQSSPNNKCPPTDSGGTHHSSQISCLI